MLKRSLARSFAGPGFPSSQTTPARDVLKHDWTSSCVASHPQLEKQHRLELMEEDKSQILEHAHSEFKGQDFAQAEELYTKFISSCLQSRECEASDLATAYNNRGQIKYLRVDFHEAVEDYTSAIQSDSRFEIPFYNRGLIHYRLGFFDDAKNDFQQALKLNPDFEDAKVSLQQTLLDQEQKINRGY